MPRTKTVNSGAHECRRLVEAFEGLSFDYWGRRVEYANNVSVIKKPADVPEKLKAYGDLVYVGDPVFALNGKNRPLSNAGCLFLPGLFPEIKNPVYIACKVNHGEGLTAFVKIVEAIRGKPFTNDEQVRLATEFYSPAKIVGEHEPHFLVRKEEVPDGMRLAELGRLFARHYMRVPSERARIDVLDKKTRDAFIRSGRRHILEPLHGTPQQEVAFIKKHQGATPSGVRFHYANRERFLTVAQLSEVVEDFRQSEKDGSDRELLSRRLSEIVALRNTPNEYMRLVAKQEVPELRFFAVDENKFNAGDMEAVMQKMDGGIENKKLVGELDSLMEKCFRATPQEYHFCDPVENPVFRRGMIRALYQLPLASAYEVLAEWLPPRSPVAQRILPQLKAHFGDHPINFGLIRHTASKRAIAGERLTGIAEVWDNPDSPKLIHVRDSYFNAEECLRTFRMTSEGSLVGRGDASGMGKGGVEFWEGKELDGDTLNGLVDEYVRYKQDRIAAQRILFRHLGDEDMMMESKRLGDTSLWVRNFRPEFIAIDKRPARDYENTNATEKVQAAFGKILCVNLSGTASPLIGTGDELYNPANSTQVCQTDATRGYNLGRLSKKIVEESDLYVMGAVYETEQELLSEIMGVSSDKIGGIRTPLLESFVDAERRIENELPVIIDDVEKEIFDAPRTSLAGNRFNMQKKLLAALTHFIDPERADAGMLFDRLANMRYRGGGRVLNPGDKNDEQILDIIDSARKGGVYSKPEDVAELISRKTDEIMDAGRRIVATENLVENKTELTDAFIVALTVDCERVDDALKIINGDESFADATFNEKFDRLRALKLKQAVRSQGGRSVGELIGHALGCMSECGQDRRAAEEKFFQTLEERFPGLYFTEEDSRFFFRAITDHDKRTRLQKLGYF